MRGILRGEQSPEEIKQFLLTYNAREATPSELGGFLAAVREAATKVDLPSEIAARAIDIVGTGGDNSGSVNVSTMTSLVVAGAGVPVCKHGNRSASSKCGTADVLEALGARIELTPEQVVRCVNVAGFGFIFAQKFHPAFRHVGPVRRELGVPTIFNLLGPMANPAPVSYMLVGVADSGRVDIMARALAERTKRAWVVHGHGGLDELSLAGPNHVSDTEAGLITVDGASIGLPRANNNDLRGGDPAQNAAIVREVLESRLRGPIRDVVVLNAAAALVVAGAARDLANGALLATAAIDSGTARATLDAFIAETTLNS
ncbi:MAG: anthranilate phosphoribosyltransferase [Actinobacteria bacterium]|nr:anthranilate phosphoribosyltransferase [Actinomycetota bacterium]